MVQSNLSIIRPRIMRFPLIIRRAFRTKSVLICHVLKLWAIIRSQAGENPLIRRRHSVSFDAKLALITLGSSYISTKWLFTPVALRAT